MKKQKSKKVKCSGCKRMLELFDVSEAGLCRECERVYGFVPKAIKEPWEMTRTEWQQAKEELRPDWTGGQEKGIGGMGRATSEKGLRSRVDAQDARRNFLDYGITKESELRPLPEDMVRMGFRIDHSDVVYRALKQNKPVPAEVLKDYPEFGDCRALDD